MKSESRGSMSLDPNGQWNPLLAEVHEPFQVLAVLGSHFAADGLALQHRQHLLLSKLAHILSPNHRWDGLN